MSAEPGRKTAYSNDLRWRIVYQRIAMNLPLVKIAQNLNVRETEREMTHVQRSDPEQ